MKHLNIGADRKGYRFSGSFLTVCKEEIWRYCTSIHDDFDSVDDVSLMTIHEFEHVYVVTTGTYRYRRRVRVNEELSIVECSSICVSGTPCEMKMISCQKDELGVLVDGLRERERLGKCFCCVQCNVERDRNIWGEH